MGDNLRTSAFFIPDHLCRWRQVVCCHRQRSAQPMDRKSLWYYSGNAGLGGAVDTDAKRPTRIGRVCSGLMRDKAPLAQAMAG